MGTQSVITAWCYLLTQACAVLSGGLHDHPPYSLLLNPIKRPYPGRGADFPWHESVAALPVYV